MTVSHAVILPAYKVCVLGLNATIITGMGSTMRNKVYTWEIMLAFVSPTNPENLVVGCLPLFFLGPFENMGLLYEPYGYKS